MGGIYGEGNYFLEEKKKREGKGGKILEKENMYLRRERGKYLINKTMFLEDKKSREGKG